MNLEINLTKDQILSRAADVIGEVNEGNVNALTVMVYCKKMEVLIEALRTGIKSQALEMIHEKHTFLGVTVEIANFGTKYNYAGSGDLLWTRAHQQLKEREEILKSLKKPTDFTVPMIIDSRTGEVLYPEETFTVNPPVKTVTESIKLTLN